MRFTKSFLLSLNLHIWGIGLFSLVWVLSKQDSPPEHVEVKFLKLPRDVAVVEGESSRLPELVGIQDLARKLPGQAKSSFRTNPQPDQRTSGKGQPTVTYRVRIADDRPDRDLVRRGSEKSFADMPYVALEQSSASKPPQTTGHRPQRQADEVSFKGDTRPLLEIIQARIDAVTPLAHASAPGCQDQSGVVKIAFLVDSLGYPCGMRITQSSGSRCLDEEVDNILHLAEPYPYMAGWVPVTVRFTL